MKEPREFSSRKGNRACYVVLYNPAWSPTTLSVATFGNAQVLWQWVSQLEAPELVMSELLKKSKSVRSYRTFLKYLKHPETRWTMQFNTVTRQIVIHRQQIL